MPPSEERAKEGTTGIKHAQATPCFFADTCNEADQRCYDVKYLHSPEPAMPNLSTILKGEITRLARKEIKAAVDPVRKANAGQRKEIAELKRQIAALKRDLKASRKPSKVVAQEGEASGRTRFSAKGLKSLRAKLGLSAGEFGLLVGASGQSIYK